MLNKPYIAPLPLCSWLAANCTPRPLSQKRSPLLLSATWSGWRASSCPTGFTVPMSSVPQKHPLDHLQHPGLKPSLGASMGPCLHTGFQSLTQVNLGSLEIIIFQEDSLSNEEATLCAAKRWQGQAMECAVLGHSMCSLQSTGSFLCLKTQLIWCGEQQQDSAFANNIASEILIR